MLYEIKNPVTVVELLFSSLISMDELLIAFTKYHYVYLKK